MKWRDEHSAPFSFMTQSQMNIDCFDQIGDLHSKNIMSSYISEKSHFSNNNCNLKNVDDSLEDNYSSPSSQMSFYQTENYSDTVFSTEECSSTLHSSCVNSEVSEGLLSKFINKTSLLKVQNSSNEDMENLVSLKNIKSITKTDGYSKSNDIEATALLDTPSSYSSCQSSQLNQDPEIPKTGFEFLDNW